MRKYLIFILFFITFSFALQGKDTYFRGFFHGKNVFVRNPYIGENDGFCIQQIYLNGELVVENPKTSAYQIDMQKLEIDSRVVIRIVHKEGCQPELINPEIIQEDLKFSWLKVYVDEDQIIWIATKESQQGFYIVEKDNGGEWLSLDTVKTKGGIFINQHSVELKHDKGDNLYRVQYHDPKKDIDFSESFNFYSDKEEISHAIDEERWVIEFTQEVSYLLYNNDSKIIKRGTDVSCDIQKFPKGQYMIKYDGKEVYFNKQ